jgi:hypothetical protein
LSHPSGDPQHQWPYKDGNLDDCDGSGNDIIVVVGGPCPIGYEEFLVIPGPPRVTICVKRTADYDGHKEFGFLAHALILVTTGAGVPSADPNVGAGSLYCWHEEGHHQPFGPVAADDALISSVSFTVNADNVDLTGIGEGCGDFQFDAGEDCIDFCSVTFHPGLDGAYHVVVTGSQGHVYW